MPVPGTAELSKMDRSFIAALNMCPASHPGPQPRHGVAPGALPIYKVRWAPAVRLPERVLEARDAVENETTGGRSAVAPLYMNLLAGLFRPLLCAASGNQP